MEVRRRWKKLQPIKELPGKRDRVRLYKGFVKAKQAPLFANSNHLVSWAQSDNEFVDLKRERLIPYNLSSEGPVSPLGI
jgi:hypothetical protein